MKVLDWLDLQGSPRGIGLMRMLFGLILWARYGAEVAPWNPDAFSPARILLAVAFFLGTTGMVIGLYSRVSTAVTAVCLVTMYYYFGYVLDVHGWVAHHTYLMLAIVVFLALTPNGEAYSLDRWWVLSKDPEAPMRRQVHLWPVRLIALQVCAAYWWSVYDKFSWPFLSGHRLELIFRNYYLGSDLYGPWLEPSMATMSVVTVIVEILLPLALLSGRRSLQVPALVIGFLLHGVFYTLISVKTFSVQMFAAYLAFVHPDDLDAFLDRFQR